MKKLKFDDSLFGSNTYNLKKADVFKLDGTRIRHNADVRSLKKRDFT